MSDPDRDDDARDLAALFDETAQVASPPTLTRLAARAAAVPARVRGRRWLRLLPFLAPVTAAAVALPFAIAALRPASAPPLAHAPLDFYASALVDARSSSDDADELELASYGDDEDSPFAGLSAPEDDAELDAWLDATDSLVAGGG